MVVERHLKSRPPDKDGPGCEFYGHQTESPAYVARHPSLSRVACYGEDPSSLEAFIEDLLAQGVGWSISLIGDFYVEKNADGDYLVHNVTQLLYAEAD